VTDAFLRAVIVVLFLSPPRPQATVASHSPPGPTPPYKSRGFFFAIVRLSCIPTLAGSFDQRKGFFLRLTPLFSLRTSCLPREPFAFLPGMWAWTVLSSACRSSFPAQICTFSSSTSSEHALPHGTADPPFFFFCLVTAAWRDRSMLFFDHRRIRA